MNKEKIIIIVGIAIVLLVTTIVLCIHIAPIFTYCIILIFLLAFGFIMTEGMFTHAANEFENRFWSGMALFFACTCVFAPDSPLRFSNGAQLGLSIPIIILFTYLVHIYDRHLRRIVLNKVPNIMKRIRSVEFGSVQSRLNAQQKLNVLREHLDSIDQKWLSSTFQNIFLLPRVLQIEHDIISIFNDVDDEQLNFIMTKVQLGRIFYKIKDHRIARRFNRTKLLELLSITRLKELNVYAKAMLLHAFQIMKLSAHPLSEVYIKNILLSTKEDDLSELKCIMDTKGDIYSMHKLIFEDIRDKTIQTDILNYISLQAKIQQGHNTIRSRKGKKRIKLAWRKILSDVDDTLTCSGGSYPAGVDTSFPKKAIYPGVLSFYRELDLGTSGDEEWNDSLLGNLVFLSARPHVYKDVSEGVTYDKFTMLQQRRGLYTSPSLLAGSLDTGSKFILKDDLEPLAENKFKKFTEYVSLYPEYQYIFIGDNGQGDVRAAEMALESSHIYKQNMQRIYIHEVKPLHQTYTKHILTRLPYESENSICYFKTYIDAAIDAYQHHLITINGLKRIMNEAINDFHYITPEDWKKCELLNYGSHTTSSVSRLTQDHTRQRLKSRISLKPMEIQLFHYQLTMEPKYDMNIRELNSSLIRGNSILIKYKQSSISLIKYKIRYTYGSVVQTPYGRGIVNRFRPHDGIYEVLIQWDSTGSQKPIKAYMLSHSLLPISPPPTMTSHGLPGLYSIAHVPTQLPNMKLSHTFLSSTTKEGIIGSSTIHNSGRNSILISQNPPHTITPDVSISGNQIAPPTPSLVNTRTSNHLSNTGVHISPNTSTNNANTSTATTAITSGHDNTSATSTSGSRLITPPRSITSRVFDSLQTLPSSLPFLSSSSSQKSDTSKPSSALNSPVRPSTMTSRSTKEKPSDEVLQSESIRNDMTHVPLINSSESVFGDSSSSGSINVVATCVSPLNKELDIKVLENESLISLSTNQIDSNTSSSTNVVQTAATTNVPFSTTTTATTLPGTTNMQPPATPSNTMPTLLNMLTSPFPSFNYRPSLDATVQRSQTDYKTALSGILVWTPYGIGVIDDYRAKDDMMVVFIHNYYYHETKPIMTVYIPRLHIVQITPSQKLNPNTTISNMSSSYFSMTPRSVVPSIPSTNRFQRMSFIPRLDEQYGRRSVILEPLIENSPTSSNTTTSVSTGTIRSAAYTSSNLVVEKRTSNEISTYKPESTSDINEYFDRYSHPSTSSQKLHLQDPNTIEHNKLPVFHDNNCQHKPLSMYSDDIITNSSKLQVEEKDINNERQIRSLSDQTTTTAGGGGGGGDESLTTHDSGSSSSGSRIINPAIHDSNTSSHLTSSQSTTTTKSAIKKSTSTTSLGSQNSTMHKAVSFDE